MKKYLSILISVFMTLTIAAQSSGSSKEYTVYKLITSTDQLSVGSKFVIVNENKNYAMGKQQKINGKYSTNRDRIEMLSTDYYTGDINILKAPAEVCPLTLKKNDNGAWVLYDESYDGFSTVTGGYLKNPNKSSTIEMGASIATNSPVEITIGTDSKATIKFTQTNKYISVSSASAIFSCTATEAASAYLYLYRKETISISDEADNSTVLTANNGKPVNVTLTRKLLNGVWNTLCLPFDITKQKLGDLDAQIMELDRIENNTIYFKTAEAIVAGKAYLVKPTKDIENPTYDGVEITKTTPDAGTQSSGSMDFIGTINPRDMSTTEEAFINAQGELLRPMENAYRMKGLRCYFVIPSTIIGAKVAFPELEDDQSLGGGISAVQGLTIDKPKSKDVYSVTGQRISKNATANLPKGIYIVGGRKIVVK